MSEESRTTATSAENWAQYRHRASAATVKTPPAWTTVKYGGEPTAKIRLMLGQTVEDRFEAGMELLYAGEEYELVAEKIPLTEEAVTLLMKRAPEQLETILPRLWDFRGVNHREGWPYTGEGPLPALLNAHEAAQVAAEVLATWNGRHLTDYMEAVRALGGRRDRLETYLTLLADWRAEAGTEKYGAPAAVTIRAACAAEALHP